MKTLTFQNTQINVTSSNGEDWVRGITIFDSLGCKTPKQSLGNFCKTHWEELESLGAIKKMKVKTNGGTQECVMLNRKGAWVAGMVSRTEKAKEFRKWVLDVLEKKAKPQYEMNRVQRDAFSEIESLHEIALKPQITVNMLKAIDIKKPEAIAYN